MPRWLVAAVVAQFAVIAILGALLAIDRAQAPALYHALAARPAADARAASIVIVLDPDVRERDVQRILRAAGARIVDGPTAGNGYLLQVAAERRDGALDVLRAERAVLIAEPLDGAQR